MTSKAGIDIKWQKIGETTKIHLSFKKKYQFERLLTVVAVLVDLRVRADLHSGSLRHLGDPAFQAGFHHQVVMLIDASELLPDGQFLIPWQKGHLSLPCELPPFRGQRKG